MLLYGFEELPHGGGESGLQLVQCRAVCCIDAVESVLEEETEPVLQACYSLLHCAVDQLSDLVALTGLQVSGEGWLHQGEG